MLPGLETIAAGLLYLAAGSIECSRQPLPQIRIIPSKSAIRYDNSKSQRELDAVEVDTDNPYGSSKETHTGGLMSGEIRVEHQLSFMQERYQQLRKVCLHYNNIEIKISIQPTIYIVRDHRPGTCRYNAILEHEKKHVEVDRIVVKKYSKRLGQALSFALNKYGATFGPFEENKVEPVQTKLQNYIDGIVKAETERMNTERKVMQQKIDSLEEYERVRKKCAS